MVTLVRLALQVVLFFLLLSAVVGIASELTGIVEKALLVVLAAGLVWLAVLVRRLGTRPPPHAR